MQPCSDAVPLKHGSSLRRSVTLFQNDRINASRYRMLKAGKIEPADGIEKYIGAWGHMLAASDDLIDMIHTHPFIADGGPEMQFNVYFPRERMYRVWVQFQRKGVVNTAQFDVPVEDLK